MCYHYLYSSSGLEGGGLPKWDREMAKIMPEKIGKSDFAPPEKFPVQ